MFVLNEITMGIVGVVTVLVLKQGKSHNTLRRRRVEGSIHQYSISPSQTIWSTRFYAPKLRRLVLIIALALMIDSRTLNTPQKQIVILALHTSYIPKNHGGMNPLYSWLMKKHTRFKDGVHSLPLDVQTNLENHSHTDSTPRKYISTNTTDAHTTPPPGPISQTLLRSN